MKGKNRGRGLISIEMCAQKKLGLYLRKSNEMLLKSVKGVGIVKTESIMEKKDSRKIVKMS